MNLGEDNSAFVPFRSAKERDFRGAKGDFDFPKDQLPRLGPVTAVR
jgi:hypothetical protein